MEEPGRVLGRLGGGVERAVVGQHPGAQAQDLAVAGRGDLAVHVVVAGERGRHQVLGPVLHPLDRPAGHHRRRRWRTGSRGRPGPCCRTRRRCRARRPGSCARARPATSEYSVRCACGAWVVAPQRQLPADAVQVGDHAAGLQRRGMRAGVEHVLGHHDVGGGERGVGRGLVAGLPVEDVVVGLAGQVVADHRGAGVQRPLGVDHRRQRLVLDADELQGVAGRVAVLGDHERDLLALVADLVGGQHGLHVAWTGSASRPGRARPASRR